MTRRKKKFLFGLLIAVAAVVLGGYFFARYCATQYGRRIAGAFSLVSKSGFADTAGLRQFLEEPELNGYRERVRMTFILGSGYQRRMEELERGMIYYSEQYALPSTQRFSAPAPTFQYLPLDRSDSSDEGISNATSNLILAYLQQM